MGLFGENETEEKIKYKSVLYNGGSSQHFVKKGLLSPLGIGGDIFIKNDMIVFASYNKKTKIEMPLAKIDFSKIKISIGSRGSNQEAMAFAGAGMALGSVGAMMKDLFIEIPFIDEQNKKQNPIFEFINKGSAENFQKWIYNRIPEESEKSKNSKENPLEILKIRYAKGEISKKEYEEMKKFLGK